MQKDIFILGGEQSDFSLNWSRREKDISELMQETVHLSLEQTKIDLHEVESVHIGNFVAELFCGQGLLGGVLAEVIPEFNGLPITRHEAACASGSMAAIAAMKDILSGEHQLSCVVGVEYMRNTPGAEAAHNLGAAAWIGKEADGVKFMWPHMFSKLSEEYEKRYGIDYQHIAAIAKNNYGNAQSNPNAQTRGWEFKEESFSLDDELNPVVDGHVRRNDCSQITDGAAVIYLASEAYATKFASRNGLDLSSIPRIKAGSFITAGISYQGKIDSSTDQGLIFPHVSQCIKNTFNKAKVDLSMIDVIETHDCFAITEYMAIDHFGITSPGESWKAIENETISKDGKLPINPGGGLIGTGHPVGATGVRMLLDAWKQISNKAEGYQIENTKNVATLNIGGSATTTACFVVGV